MEPTPQTMQIGKAMARARDAAELTQDALAEKAGLAAGAMIAQYEAGTKQPSLLKLIALARHCGVSLDVFVGLAPPGSGAPGQVINNIQGERPTVYQHVEHGYLLGTDPLPLLKHLIDEALQAALPPTQRPRSVDGAGAAPPPS